MEGHSIESQGDDEEGPDYEESEESEDEVEYLGNAIAKTHRRMHGLPTPDKKSAEKVRPSVIRNRRKRKISYDEDELEEEVSSPQEMQESSEEAYYTPKASSPVNKVLNFD